MKKQYGWTKPWLRELAPLIRDVSVRVCGHDSWDGPQYLKGRWVSRQYIRRRTWKIPGLPAGGGNLMRTRTQFLRWSPVPKGKDGSPAKAFQQGGILRGIFPSHVDGGRRVVICFLHIFNIFPIFFFKLSIYSTYFFIYKSRRWGVGVSWKS